jgi:multiple sugar transport system permease protein
MALLLMLTAFPAGVVIWMSFQKTKYFDLMGFVGLSNYQDLLSSEAFWQLSRTSVTFVFGGLLLVLPIGLLTALLIQSLGRWGNALRVIILVPWTLSQAVVGSFWLWILNPSFGPIAYLVREIGLQPGLMLGDPAWALPVVIMVTAWWSFPYATVLMSAALQAVPKELYEALAIDGGGRMQSLRYVVWPHVAPAMGSTGLTLGILYLMLVTMIIVLTGGGPFGLTTTWSLQIFQGTAQSVNLAPTATLSVVVLVANLMLGLGYLRLTGRARG